MHVSGCYYYVNIKLNLSIALIAADEKCMKKCGKRKQLLPCITGKLDTAVFLPNYSGVVTE